MTYHCKTHGLDLMVMRFRGAPTRQTFVFRSPGLQVPSHCWLHANLPRIASGEDPIGTHRVEVWHRGIPHVQECEIGEVSDLQVPGLDTAARANLVDDRGA